MPNAPQPSTSDYLRSLWDAISYGPSNSPVATVARAVYPHVPHSAQELSDAVAQTVGGLRSTANRTGDLIQREVNAFRANPRAEAARLATKAGQVVAPLADPVALALAVKHGYIDPIAQPIQQAAQLHAAGGHAAAARMAPLAVLGALGLDMPGAGGAVERAAAHEAEDLAVRGAEQAAAKNAPLAVKAAPQRGIMATPDLRTMDTAAAIEAARAQPHLIQDATGQYVGAPRGVSTPEDLAVMRANFDKDVAAGAHGADWYTRARASNKEWAGPDPARQRLLAQEQALWSAQANPDTNLNFGLQGHNAYEMGTPLDKVRTGAQAETYNTARDMGVDIPLGKKTGIYGQHLDPTAPHATTGTNDIWHARGFGYTNPGGEQFSGGLTEQEHRFLDYETMLAVDRANAAKLAGRGDWQAHEIQAAPWVAGKGRGVAEARKLTPEEGIQVASMTYPDYRGKYTAHATGERMPFVNAGHLSGLFSADEGARTAYSMDPRASWADPQGRDILYDALGAYQTPTMHATGVYTPPGGVTENNIATVAKPLVGLKEGDYDPASRAMLDVAEGLRAYTDVQGAGAHHIGLTNVTPGQQGSITIPHVGPVDVDRIMALKALGEKHGLPDIVDTGEGLTMTNFDPGPPTGAQTGKALKSGLSRDIAAITGAMPSRVKVASGYIPMFEKAGAPGSGIATHRLEDLFSQYPGLIDKLDQNAALRARYQSGADLDAEMAAKGLGDVRPDVQLARNILADKGLRGLFEARKAGVALPAIAGLAAIPALAPRQPSAQDEGSI